MKKNKIKIVSVVFASFILGIWLNEVIAAQNPGHMIAQMGCDANDACTLRVKSLGVNGYNPAGGYPSGWGNAGVHSGYLYSEGKIGLGKSQIARSYIDKDGNAFFDTSVGVGGENPEYYGLYIKDGGLKINTDCNPRPPCGTSSEYTYGALIVCEGNSICPTTGYGLEACDAHKGHWDCVEPLND